MKKKSRCTASFLTNEPFVEDEIFDIAIDPPQRKFQSPVWRRIFNFSANMSSGPQNRVIERRERSTESTSFPVQRRVGFRSARRELKSMMTG